MTQHNIARCAGHLTAIGLHRQCGNCKRLTTPQPVTQPRVAHMLPPEFAAGQCPMRLQS